MSERNTREEMHVNNNQGSFTNTECNMTTCAWYNKEEHKCEILCELQCKKKKKRCSFYEDKESLEKRHKVYEEMINTYIERIKKIGEKNKWSKGRIIEEIDDLLKLSNEDKEEYLKELEGYKG